MTSQCHLRVTLSLQNDGQTVAVRDSTELTEDGWEEAFKEGPEADLGVIMEWDNTGREVGDGTTDVAGAREIRFKSLSNRSHVTVRWEAGPALASAPWAWSVLATI